jgi:predicted DNA binding CopG/RHH family protein
MKYELDPEEKDLIDSINSGNWQKSSDENDDISRHIEYAKNYLKKDKQINILLSSKDLELIQRKAVAEGLSYQTLVSSILHKYINGYI